LPWQMIIEVSMTRLKVPGRATERPTGVRAVRISPNWAVAARREDPRTISNRHYGE